MRVLVVEDEPYMADAIRDGLRLEAIAADIAGDGHSALELLGINSYDLAILDRDVPPPSGDEIARRIVASGSGIPILMLTAADRIDDKASGFQLGADDYLTKPFEFRELVMRLRALDRRRAQARPPVTEIAGLRLDPFRREVSRDGRHVALTRKQFAVLEVLVAADGGVVSAEELCSVRGTRTRIRSPTPCASRCRRCADASATLRSSPPWPGPDTASTQRPAADTRQETVDRDPGLSVRSKLALSYAGFLMLASALLLAAVWLSILRYIPDEVTYGLPWFPPNRSDPLNGFGLPAAIVLAFLLVFGLLGGWILAGHMLAPLARIRDATRMATTGSLAHRIRLPGRSDEFRELSDAFDAMLARLEAHVAEQQRFAPTPPTSCARRWRSRRHFSTSPATIRTATPAS
jgi:two-component system response regulator VanR